MPFLTLSNLSRETLKSLWTLADTNSSGYLSRAQFFVLMRLISCALSSTYAGYTPNMQMYYDTIYVDIALPAMGEAPIPTSATIQARRQSEPTLHSGGGHPNASEMRNSGANTSAEGFSKGDRVMYMETDEVIIVGRHMDDYPNIYYTIQFSDGREKQTIVEKLSPLGLAAQSSTAIAILDAMGNSPNSAALMTMSMNEGDGDDEEFSDFSDYKIASPVAQNSSSDPMSTVSEAADKSEADMISFPPRDYTEDKKAQEVSSVHVDTIGSGAEDDEDFDDFQEAPSTPTPTSAAGPSIMSDPAEPVHAKDFSVFDDLLNESNEPDLLGEIVEMESQATVEQPNALNEISEISANLDCDGRAFSNTATKETPQDEDWNDFATAEPEPDLMGFDEDTPTDIPNSSNDISAVEANSMVTSSTETRSEKIFEKVTISTPTTDSEKIEKEKTTNVDGSVTIKERQGSLTASSSDDILSLFGSPSETTKKTLTPAVEQPFSMSNSNGSSGARYVIPFPASPMATTSTGIEDEDFGDFNTATSTDANKKDSTTATCAGVSVENTEDWGSFTDEDFQGFTEAASNDDVHAKQTDECSSNDRSSSELGQSVTIVNDEDISPDQLYTFANILSTNFHYEEALLCLRQQQLRLAIRRGQVNLTSQLCTKEEEEKWMKLASSGEIGVSVEEQIDLLSMMHEDTAAIFEKEIKFYGNKDIDLLNKNLDDYLNGISPEEGTLMEIFRPRENRDPLAVHLIAQIIMKRRLKCAVAIFTSHRNIFNAWDELLQISYNKLEEAENNLKNYCRNDAPDDRKLEMFTDKTTCVYFVNLSATVFIACMTANIVFETSLVMTVKESCLAKAGKILEVVENLKNIFLDSSLLLRVFGNSVFLGSLLSCLTMRATEDILISKCDRMKERITIVFCDLMLSSIRVDKADEVHGDVCEMKEGEIITSAKFVFGRRNKILGRVQQTDSGCKFSSALLKFWKNSSEMGKFPSIDTPFLYD